MHFSDMPIRKTGPPIKLVMQHVAQQGRKITPTPAAVQV